MTLLRKKGLTLSLFWAFLFTFLYFCFPTSTENIGNTKSPHKKKNQKTICRYESISFRLLAVFVDARKHRKCYKVIKKPRNDISWENAVEECRWRHGGHLVKINNEAEDMLLKSFLREENCKANHIIKILKIA